MATANERGREITAQLKDLIKNKKTAKNIIVNQPPTWGTIKEMEIARGFQDRPLGDGKNKFPQDIFTRSAHIKIIDSGLCDVSN